MYTAKPTSRFAKDLKRAQKRGYNMSLLTEVIKKLTKGETLEAKYRDHPLKGDYEGCRECHITPDWLLIYKPPPANSKPEDGISVVYLYLTRTGTHSDLF